MPITLNHTIVPSQDKESSASFCARIMGLPDTGAAGHFAQVRVNADLALDDDNRERFESHHYPVQPWTRWGGCSRGPRWPCRRI